ncbi:uncharacterized protein LOC110378845 [Helicoverpa armigera]|uniref:Uncharacterized protein n=1 Tax=Helicoverpa armigera TaxID=29058 RepID=A0A2W1BJK6_HELAM|nr:uncharacterized protein LOC110378845 [Helicoverpa armigera]XP_047029025.1 uncharacterized protein LOC124636866 [Helicoverpa zea]PZC75229.1 hypothetical protein B5X24_HaOG206536 [Helicoverpa armigera]
MTDTTTTPTLVKVKTERPDEAEIRELAAKMVEANKAKALAASVAAARPPPGSLVGVAPPGSGGQMGILNFLQRKPAANTTTELRPAPEGDKKNPAPDEASWKGHFGWDMLGKCHIPYIYRSTEKYVAVRMVEIKLLNKYLNYLHADIYSCTCIRSYYITEIEARLLNEINNRHCDGQFGREPFTQKDLVVRLSDAYEFYNFLDVCYNKLLRGTTNSKDKCGFIRINKESVVPYTVRDNQKFVPLFYFEGETDNLKLKADQLKGWDLSYLKFCCKVQGIRNELFASETCSVISLSDIKSYFPPGTEFEEYWPNKVVDSQLLISAKGSVSGGGQWTRAPPAPPPGVVGGVGVGSGGGVGLNNVSSQSTRGRRATTQRHSPASAAMQMPHAGLSAAAVQALANGWSLPGALTQAQTQQVLRLAQAQVAQAHVAARYNNAAIAAAAAGLPQHRSQHQRTVQFPNSAITMAMGQQPPPPLVRSSANTSTMNVPPQVTGTMNGHSTSHSVDSRKRLTPIPDITITGNHTPYKVQKALVENTMVPCINAKPYQYTELLMTLPDLASHFFPRVSLTTCRAMLDALGITLYRPNSTQLQVLRNTGKCKSAAAGENGLALVQIRDVMQHMLQFKYMLRSGLAGDEAPHGTPRPAHAPPPQPKRARAN